MPRVNRVSAVEAAIDEMRAQIRDGHWRLGDRLPSEAELTEMLGISRAPLREATRALVHAGLLTVRQGDGTYVAAIDEAEVALGRKLRASHTRDVLEVRRGLDASAVRLAATRRTKGDLAAMATALRHRAEAATEGDRDAFADADVAFHLAIAKAAHNALLLHLYEGISAAIRDSLDAPEPLEHAISEHDDDHTALYEAIRSGDPDRAVAAAIAIIAEQETQRSTTKAPRPREEA